MYPFELVFCGSERLTVGATPGKDWISHQGPVCPSSAVLQVALSLLVNLSSRERFLIVTLPMEGWTRDQVTWGQSWLGHLSGWHFILCHPLCLLQRAVSVNGDHEWKGEQEATNSCNHIGVAVKVLPQSRCQSSRKGTTFEVLVQLLSGSGAHPMLPSGKLSSLSIHYPRGQVHDLPR